MTDTLRDQVADQVAAAIDGCGIPLVYRRQVKATVLLALAAVPALSGDSGPGLREALGPAPNVPECTCDRADDSWVGEPGEMPLCPYHEKRLRRLSWESLACMVIDYEAALAAAAAEQVAGAEQGEQG